MCFFGLMCVCVRTMFLNSVIARQVADFYQRYPSCHLHEFKMHPRITAALEAHPKGMPPFFGKTAASDFWSLVEENTVAPAESLLLESRQTSGQDVENAAASRVRSRI